MYFIDDQTFPDTHKQQLTVRNAKNVFRATNCRPNPYTLLQLIGSVVLLPNLWTEGELIIEGRPVYGQIETMIFWPAYRKIMVLMYIVHVYVYVRRCTIVLLNVHLDKSSGASSTSILYVSERQRLW